jgi:hypothetical protein
LWFLTGLFLYPFTGLIAMLVYGLIAWAIERIIFLIFYRPAGPVTATNITNQHTLN